MKKETALVDNRPVPAAAKDSISVFEYVQVRWRLVAPKGTKPEDLTRPEFYSIVGEKLKTFDEIVVVAENFWASVLVRYSEKGSPVSALVLNVVDLPTVVATAQQMLPPGFRIDFDPLQNTYQAVRERDDVAMTPPLPNFEICRTELVNHASLRSS